MQLETTARMQLRCGPPPSCAPRHAACELRIKGGATKESGPRGSEMRVRSTAALCAGDDHARHTRHARRRVARQSFAPAASQPPAAVGWLVAARCNTGCITVRHVAARCNTLHHSMTGCTVRHAAAGEIARSSRLRLARPPAASRMLPTADNALVTRRSCMSHA